MHIAFRKHDTAILHKYNFHLWRYGIYSSVNLHLSPLNLCTNVYSSAIFVGCFSSFSVMHHYHTLCAWHCCLTEKRRVMGLAERIMINHHTLWFIFHLRQPLCACRAAPIWMQIAAALCNALADLCAGSNRALGFVLRIRFRNECCQMRYVFV